jgi:alpha-ketoglutarate-dependent taurine dioxygenase
MMLYRGPMTRTGLPNQIQSDDIGIRSQGDLLTWAVDRRTTIADYLHTVGALLLRRTPVGSAEEHAEVASEFCGPLQAYVEGSSQRLQLAARVYTSTEYPARYRISLHNELSYASRWPARLCFSCLEAPRSGGETPILDSRVLVRALSQDLVNEFERRRVRYIRRLHHIDDHGLGVSWQGVFETHERAQVDAYCEQGDVQHEWEGRTLVTSQIRSATRLHPTTGEKVWFNQADQFHPTNIGGPESADLIEAVGEENLPTNATFGDGGQIPVDMLEEVRATAWAHCIATPWSEGDILVLDNMLVAHGRMPFVGPRRVLVAMGG